MNPIIAPAVVSLGYWSSIVSWAPVTSRFYRSYQVWSFAILIILIPDHVYMAEDNATTTVGLLGWLRDGAILGVWPQQYLLSCPKWPGGIRWHFKWKPMQFAKVMK